MGLFVVCLMASIAFLGTEGLSLPAPLDWTPGVNACIRGNNNRIADQIFTFFDCKYECQFETGFRCKSVEYHSNSRRCVLSDANRDSHIHSYSQPCHDSGWTYSQVNDFCAAEGSACAGQNSGGTCRSDCNFANGESVSPFNSCGGSGCTCCIPPSFPADWTFETDSCILGHNNLILRRVSLADCKARCENNPGFFCRSVEYHYSTSRCSLSEADSTSSSYRYQCPSNTGWIFTEIAGGAPPPAASIAPSGFGPAPPPAAAAAPEASGSDGEIP